MIRRAKSSAPARYKARILVLSLFYAAFILADTYAFKHSLVSGPLAYVAAILPALAIIGMFAAMARYLVEETDEYQRMLVTRQMLWAGGFAFSVATAWGFLQAYDLAPKAESYWVAVLWFGGLGLGSIANRIIEQRGA